jgi:ribosomal protein S21
MATIREDETLSDLIKRFNKEVDREGILADYRKHEFFVKPSQLRHEFKKKKQRDNRRNSKG